MKQFFLLGILLLSSAFVLADDQSADNPGSLYSDKVVNPILDRTARKEGDILTLLISETSTASFAASTDTSKTEANSVGKQILPILSTMFPNLIPNLSGSSSGSLSTKAAGTTTSTGKFAAKLSCVVKSVLPNGNMVIEGTKFVKVNKDTQNFVLSGIIRRDDVRPDNSVLSESLAEAKITVDGKGAISERQRKGILSRIIDWLF